MGDVIKVDFRKPQKPGKETLDQMAARIFDNIVLPASALDALYVDTAPSEYVAPGKDFA